MSDSLELKFALLADHVTETRQGKLVIVGEFDTVGAAQAPVTHAPMFLVARMEAEGPEAPQPSFQIGLFDDAGDEVIPPSPPNPVRMVRTGSGRWRGQIIVQLGAVQFPDFGTFEFRLLIDGMLLAAAPVHVVRIEAQQQPPPGTTRVH